jgi:hypothetical protein
LQSKQKAIAAIKAQQYPEAVHILAEGEQLQDSRIVNYIPHSDHGLTNILSLLCAICAVRDASPGGILLDPVLAEMLSTLQQKVAQGKSGFWKDLVMRTSL